MNMPKVLGTCLFIILTIDVIEATLSPVFEQVYRFLNDNGHRYVDIFYNSSSTKWLGFRPKDISFATIPLRKVNMIAMHGTFFGVFIMDSRNDDYEAYLKMIVNRKVRKSLLVIMNLGEGENMKELLQYLHKMETPSHFYVANLAQGSDVKMWHQMFSLASGAIFDALTFEDNSLKVLESINLQGLDVTSTSLTWEPLYTIDDCNDVGLECATTYGLLQDYMDIFSNEFNFTFISQKNLDNDWGMVPKENGTYGGVIGDVYSKKYDLTISTWQWFLERDSIADFVPVNKNREVLAKKSGRSATDFGLYMRVFTYDSWISILILALAISVCLLIVKSWAGRYKRGRSLLVFILLIFFVVIRAFYGGALTKFFTVSVQEPFESKKDVLEAYPQYNLMIRDGYQNMYLLLMMTGDPAYKELWERISQSPEQTIYATEKEGFKLMNENGGNILAFDQNVLLGYLKTNINEEAPYVFAHDRWVYHYMMLQDNSPLTALFTHCVESLREKGIDKQINLKWIGELEQDSGAILSAIVLMPGQVILIFSLLMVIYGVTIIMLCGEVVASKKCLVRI